MSQPKKLSDDFPELLKLETSIISFLYVVLGFSVTAITGQNNLLFKLASDGKPEHFIPYWPLFSDIVNFTIINMVWVAIGLYGSFHSRMVTANRPYVAYANGVVFILALGYFAYTASNLVRYFKF
ncbi:MAG: hypothetical protein ABJK37_09165 [Paraglaciecola sp.]|uniref:hypothetical protein n=1 Tax=Paraglaciecola sp. TaxID=1920173 RepID=UPI0032989E0C